MQIFMPLSKFNIIISVKMKMILCFYHVYVFLKLHCIELCPPTVISGAIAITIKTCENPETDHFCATFYTVYSCLMHTWVCSVNTLAFSTTVSLSISKKMLKLALPFQQPRFAVCGNPKVENTVNYNLHRSELLSSCCLTRWSKHLVNLISI